jgi:hypothetical protein
VRGRAVQKDRSAEDGDLDEDGGDDKSQNERNKHSTTLHCAVEIFLT